MYNVFFSVTFGESVTLAPCFVFTVYIQYIPGNVQEHLSLQFHKIYFTKLTRLQILDVKESSQFTQANYSLLCTVYNLYSIVFHITPVQSHIRSCFYHCIGLVFTFFFVCVHECN